MHHPHPPATPLTPPNATGDTTPTPAIGKRRAAASVIATLTDGMTVGLGSGSTVWYVGHALQTVTDPSFTLTLVPSSPATRLLAERTPFPVASLETIHARNDTLDCAIDGADQLLLPSGTAIKGGGGAHAQERAVAAAAETVHVIVDWTKLTWPSRAGTPRLCDVTTPIPVSVTPTMQSAVEETLFTNGFDPTRRTTTAATGEPQPVITPTGHHILDCTPLATARTNRRPLREAATQLTHLDGIASHGLCPTFADVVHIGRPADQLTVHLAPESTSE